MPYAIRCDVVAVGTQNEICPGSAACRKGETYVITARTPESGGMCCRAFHAVHPMAWAMRWSERLAFEKDGIVEVVCPDGFVTYRLARVREP